MGESEFDIDKFIKRSVIEFDEKDKRLKEAKNFDVILDWKPVGPLLLNQPLEFDVPYSGDRFEVRAGDDLLLCHDFLDPEKLPDEGEYLQVKHPSGLVSHVNVWPCRDAQGQVVKLRVKLEITKSESLLRRMQTRFSELFSRIK